MRTVILALLVPLAAQAFFFGNGCGCQQSACAPSACPPPVAPVCPPPPVCGGGPAYRGPYQQQQPQYAPVQQQQLQQQPVQQTQQFYQQLPIAGYAVPQQAAPAEITEEQLAAQAETHEFANNGQSATLEEESPSVPEPQVEQIQEVEDANEAAPASTAAQNTVYDDIVNAAQGATPTEEYQAAAASAASRRRYHSIRRAPAAAFDPKCNSETLKNLIHQNIGDSTSSSKRAIQKAASEEVGGHVDVICSTGTFSYIVNTELYCETEKDGITCFAFRQSN